MTHGDTIHLDFGGSLEMLDLAQNVGEYVARVAGLDEDARHWVGVAVRESVVNAIKHGNCNDAAKRVYLTFTLLPADAPGVRIRVRDEGCGFDPDSLPDPLAPENLLKSSGRGIFLIRSFMDELTFEQTPQGATEVVMVKRASSGNGAAGRADG